MSLKKPSEYFKKDIATVDSSIQELKKAPELNTFSDAFESFKNNLNKIEVLSEFSDTLDNYRVNIERVNHLSEKIEDIQTEVQTLLKKEDLDRAMMSQLLIVEQSIRDVQNKVKGINEKNLTEIRLDVSGLTESVNEFLEVEVPKYKKLVVNSEIRTNNRYEELEKNVNTTLQGISEFVDNKYQELTENLQGIAEQNLTSIIEDFKLLDDTVRKLKEEDIPKYKGFIVETERKTEFKLDEFNSLLNETVDSLLEKISLVEGNKTNLIKIVNDKIQEVVSLKDLVIADIDRSESLKSNLVKKISDLEVEVIRNESHIKIQNKNLKQIQEDVRSTIQKLNIEELEEKNYELGKKVKYLEEVFEKFSEKEILTENIIVEPPSTTNKDPLTPTDKNFVTLDQLQQHYRLFINRIQQQLATIGGGGETRLKYLDDIVGIATNASAYDGKFLKYNHTIGKFEFDTVNNIDTENIVSSSISITDSNELGDYYGDVASTQKAYITDTNSLISTSIHKQLSVDDFSTVEYTIQANSGVDINTTKIISVNNKISINSLEIHSVSTGSTFVNYSINIEDNLINLVVTPLLETKINYNILYNAIYRPYKNFILTDENENAILTENSEILIAESY